MPATVWLSPAGGNTSPYKQFLVELPLEFGTVPAILDLTAAALNAIDGGRFWRVRPTLFPVPEGNPGSFGIDASAEYAVGVQRGLLQASVIGQPKSDGSATGLLFQFSDQLQAMPLPWMLAQSESIVAQTILLVLDEIRARMGALREDAESPLQYWKWFQPSAGWRHRQSFTYRGWDIRLE